MKFMNLCFENTDLEKKFQLKILKQSQKGFILYHIIPIIMVVILIVDQALKQNIIMIYWFIGQQIILASYLVFSFIYPILFNYLSYYYYLVDIIVGTLQLFYFEFDFLSLEANDIKIYQDILLQFFLIYHTRYNYIGGSVTFIFFIFVRFYVQIGYGYSLSSIAYLLSGSFFIIDLYKQEKFRRKLFLKSQRNKQLELLIEEFIDDQVSIIEKDSENVRFKTVIFNKKIQESGDQLIQFLKDVKLPQLKEQLLNYLYKSTEQKETLLGRHQNKNYQITYQSFILKKQQMFLKIKLLDQKLDSLVNYKSLCMHLIQGLQLKPQQLYKGKQIIQYMYMKTFYYQFTRYFQYYKLDLEVITFQFLKYIFNLNKISWISNSYIKPFHSDKKLVFLLVYLIKQTKSNEILILNMDDNSIKIELSVFSIGQCYMSQFNKILYHIGQGFEQISSQMKINIHLIDMIGLEKFY